MVKYGELKDHFSEDPSAWQGRSIGALVDIINPASYSQVASDSTLATKPTFTTKGEKVKTAVKKGGTLLKKPGSTTFNALGAITLMSPLIGAYGSLKKTNIEEAESQSAYPLYKVKPRDITAEDYGQSLWHRLAPDLFRSVKEQRKWDKFKIPGDA